MRHGEEGLQTGKRPIVDASHEALQRAEHAPVRQEQRWQSGSERRWQHPFLYCQAPGELVGVDNLDLTGDACADIDAFDLARMPDAHGVDRNVGAVAEGDDVAIGGEAVAESVGHDEALLAGAQKDFRRAQRPSCKYDHLRGHAMGGAPAAIRFIEEYLPAVIGNLCNIANTGVSEDLSAPVRGEGQIRQRDGVLGADIATAAAISAACAGRLCHTGWIYSLLEADCDWRRPNAQHRTGSF